MKRRAVLDAIEWSLEGGPLVPIDLEEVPKEVRAEVVVMNRLIERAADLGRQCRAGEAERDQALRLLQAAVEAVPAASSLSAPDGTVIAASTSPLPAEHRHTIVPETDGIILAVGDVTDTPSSTVSRPASQGSSTGSTGWPRATSAQTPSTALTIRSST